MGVKNAILRIVNEMNTTGNEIYVHGPIIHNPQTISILESRGLVTVKGDEPLDGKTVAIRTHGIPHERLLEIRKYSGRLINLTCPRVANVQAIIKKHSRQGYYTVITGDVDHAEVIGLKSYASSGVSVISSPDDVRTVPAAEKYIAVSQTTFDRELFSSIIEKLKHRMGNRLLVFNTICSSTHSRQEDVANALKRGIDVLVVVGGKNSANTRRLAELGSEGGIRTFHVETSEELNEKDFRKQDRVFVTAGASTPGWIINNVLEKLYYIQYRQGSTLVNFLKKTFEFAVRTNTLSSMAAFFMALLAPVFVGAAPDYRLAAVSSLYIFSMYTFNNCFTLPFLRESNPYKHSLYSRYRNPLLILALLFLIISAALAATRGQAVITVFGISSILGILYSIKPVKSLVYDIGISALKKLYNSKTVATAFGWVIITTLMPLIAADADVIEMIALSLPVFSFIFLRNILIDIIALQGDLILGRETLPILAGTEKTKWLTTAITIVSIATFLPLALMTNNSEYILLVLSHAYYLTLLFNIVRLEYLAALKYELLVDLNLVFFIGAYWISS